MPEWSASEVDTSPYCHKYTQINNTHLKVLTIIMKKRMHFFLKIKNPMSVIG